MKKLISLILVILCAALFTFTACTPSSPVTSDTGGGGSVTSSDGQQENPPMTLDEELKEMDSKFDRVIYLTSGDTYNLAKQFEYEEIQNPTLSVVDGNNFTFADGVITPKSTDDMAHGEMTATYGDKTEKIVVHTVNKQKYGSTYLTVDAGYLYGKSVAFFGDSITHNWAQYPNGDKTAEPANPTHLGYNHIPKLHEFCNFENILNAAWSGGTVSYLPTSVERFIYKSLVGSVDDHFEELSTYDTIFIWYGTNDYTEQVPLGNPTDMTNTDGVTDQSFYAGLNYGLTKIKEANPNANIIVMTIMVRDPRPLQIKMSQYNDVLVDGAKAHNARVLNIFKLFTSKHLKDYFQDGLHPNDQGYEVITKYILKDNKVVDKRR